MNSVVLMAVILEVEEQEEIGVILQVMVVMAEAAAVAVGVVAEEAINHHTDFTDCHRCIRVNLSNL